ncbi:MAG: hypothetical protein ACI9TF_000628 [Paracrocinitomix sp.]|jgi:hypothetical protein
MTSIAHVAGAACIESPMMLIQTALATVLLGDHHRAGQGCLGGG